jgi:hypothetical protein
MARTAGRGAGREPKDEVWCRTIELWSSAGGVGTVATGTRCRLEARSLGVSPAPEVAAASGGGGGERPSGHPADVAAARGKCPSGHPADVAVAAASEHP